MKKNFLNRKKNYLLFLLPLILLVFLPNDVVASHPAGATIDIKVVDDFARNFSPLWSSPSGYLTLLNTPTVTPHTVSVINPGTISAASLSGVEVLVVPGPDRGWLTQTIQDTIRDFVQNGGVLIIAPEFGLGGFDPLLSSFPATHALGWVSVSCVDPAISFPDPAHSLINNPNPISTFELTGWRCTYHERMDGSTIGSGWTIVARGTIGGFGSDAFNNDPVLATAGFGSGGVIAISQHLGHFAGGGLELVENSIVHINSFGAVTAPPTITINSVTPSTLKWGNSVTVTGSTTGAAASNTATVRWGDGAEDTLIPVDDITGAWTASHAYASTAVGIKTIDADLVSNPVLATSNQVQVTVTKHTTTLTASFLSAPSVKWGHTFQVLATPGSTLTDLDAVGGPTPVSGKTISFSGTAVTGTPSGITAGSLVAPVTITAAGAGNVGAGKTVIGNFAEDGAYLGSVSPAATIEITKHATSLSAPTAPASIKWSFTFTASSILTDVDAVGGPAPISGKIISFSGSGVTGSSSSGPTDVAGLGTSTTVQASGIGTTGLRDISASFAAGDLDYNPTTSPTSAITITAHDTTIALDTISDLKWSFVIPSITGTLTDNDFAAAGLASAGIDAKPISLTGDLGTVPGSATTIADGTFATASGRAPGIPAGLKSVSASFAGDLDYNAPALDATTSYTTLPHDTSLELDFIPDPIQGTAFNGKGNSLTDDDWVLAGLDTPEISGKTITFDGTGSQGLAPATTGGITFTGPGLEIISCPTCSPNPDTSEPITKALRAQTGTTFTLPTDSSIVSVVVQKSDNNPFTLTGTNVEGNTCSQSATDVSPNIATLNLDCGGPAISQAEFTSVGGTGSIKVTQIKTFKPSTVDSNLISSNFEGETLGTSSSVTIADGAYHSTATAVNFVTIDPVTVMSHFGGDGDYILSDSNEREYNTQLSLGVGGSVSAQENFVKSFVSQSCGANDADGDALCNDWETTGVTYYANGNPYTYTLPGTPNQNKKNIYVELDAMTGFAPDMAAGGPIDRVITAFATAPVTNVGGETDGIILHVDDDDTSLTSEASLNVWVDTDGNANNDFGTIKGTKFGSTSEYPVLGGTQLDASPAAGLLDSFTTDISGVTISPPGDTTRWTEGTIFFKQKVTLGAAGFGIGTATAIKTSTDVGTDLIFDSPTVEVITPDALTPTVKILLVKQPFKMAPGYTTTGNNVGIITVTIPITGGSTTLTLTTPAIPPTLTTTRLDAKAQTTHYALFADSIGACGPSGIGEPKGNDFVVSLGCGFTEPSGSADEIAGTFMHELGHNVGLGHGGPSEIAGVAVQDSATNCKPLYTSVMSYSRQMPTFFSLPGQFKLDYSRGYFATPGISLAEQMLFEPLGLRANLGGTGTKILYGTPGLAVTTRSYTPPGPLAAAIATNWDGDGVSESLGGTHTTTVPDGVVNSGNDGTFTLTNIKATTGDFAAGEVKIRTVLDFGGINPGPVSASAVASALNSFTIPTAPTAVLTGIGDVRLVEITFKFTKDTAITDADIADITVTISGAIRSATFTASEGSAQVNVAYDTTSSSSKTGKVRGPTISTSTSGSITMIQKVTLTGGQATLALTVPSQSGADAPAGLTWDTPTISAVTPSGLNSALNAAFVHRITITQPYTVTAGTSLTDVSMGELTYTMTLSTARTLSTMLTEPNSPSNVQVDVNNFGITGCNASTNNVAYKDYNDWENLKYDFRGVAGGLFNARQADHEPDGGELDEQRKSKDKYSGVNSPLNQNIDPAEGGAISLVKRGQTVPNKFQLKDDNGAFVPNAQVTFVAKALNVACGTNVEAEILPASSSTSGALFTFTSPDYHYNWKIPSNWPTGVTGLSYVNNFNTAQQEVLTHFDTGSQHVTEKGTFSLLICVRK